MKFLFRFTAAAAFGLATLLALQALAGDVHAAAPSVVSSPASVAPAYGSTVTLAADVLADTSANYVWTRDDIPLIDGGRYSGAATGTLVITGANNSDNGAYTLTVANAEGSASTTPASVTVVQTPFALDPSQPVTSASTTTSSSDYANIVLHLPDGRTLLGGRGVFNGAAGTSASSGLIVIEADGRVTVPACGAFNGEITSLYRQPDGKILLTGYFSQINGVGGPARSGFTRLNPDLTVDPDFQPQATSAGRHIFSDALGRVYLAGDFSIFQGDHAYQYLVRLQPDGSLDRHYRPRLSSGIRKIAFAPDGSVYLGGQLTSYGYPATPANGVVRLRPDGMIDPAFVCTLPYSLNISALAVQADGKLLVGSYSADAPLVRLFPDGTQDTSFNYDTATGTANVAALAILPSGKILIGGSSVTSANLLFRLDADGARDTAFDGGAGLAPPTGSYAAVNSIAPDPYGRPWIAGIHFTTYDGQPASRLAVLQGDSPALALTTQPAGVVRDPGASATFTAAATGDNGFTFRWHKNGVPLSDDNRISGATTATLDIADLVASDTADYTVVVTSPTTFVTSAAAKLIVRAAPLITWAPSDLAADFGAAATFTSQAFGAAPLAYLWLHGSTELTDGTVAGVTISGATTPELTLTGLTFAEAGEYRLRATNALGAADSDLARLTVTRRPGALAAGLGPIQPMPDGPVHAILRLADGSMLIAGDFTTISVHGASQNRGRIARFLADGTLDPTFAPTFNGSISSLAQDSAGRIFVGGSFSAVTFGSSTTTARRVTRLTAALALDTAFDTTTGPDNSVEALAPTQDGGVYIGGFFSFFGVTHTGYVVRLDATGSLDPAFNATNTISDGVRSLLRRPDGRLYVGGSSGTFLLSATGVRDTGFVPHTANSSYPVSAHAMLLLPDNSLVVGGGNFFPSKYLRRLNSTSGASLADYAANHAVNNHIASLALQPDGKVLSGSFGVLKRTNPATGLDDTLEGGANLFAPFYFSAIRAIALDETGRIWVGGYFSTYNNEYRPYLAILAGGEPGSRDGLLAPQTLTFTDIPDRILGANAATNTVTLAATSDRGLTPVTYAVTSGSATITGRTLTITGTGDITVTAIQRGDATYSPVTATQTFTVTKAEQTITFAAPASRVVGTKFTLTATATPSKLPVSFAVIAGPATLGTDGKTLTLGFVAGPVTIRATQTGGAAGGLIYAPAPPVDQTFEATLSPPTQTPKIAFAKPAALTYGAAPLTLTATSSSGLPVGYEITSATTAGIAALTDGVLTITGAGKFVVKATQPGSGPYKAAAAVSQTFTVNKADLPVSFDDRVRLVAEANPTFFEPIYSGSHFVNGDTAADLAATRPRGVTKATIKSAQGDYPIIFTGGVDKNYRYVPGAPAFLTIVGFGGAYEALLVDNRGFSIGKLTLTVSKNTLGYTGTLNLARETKAIVVSSTAKSPGTTALVSTEDFSSASATWVRTGGTTLDALNLTFTVRSDGVLAGSLTRNGQDFAALSGGHLLYAPPAKTSIPWAGQHTLALHSAFVPVFTPEEKPFPRGSGVATALVSATNGNLVIKGLLADGTKLSATLKPWITRTEGGALDQVGYVAWITPYGTRAESFISGPVHLLPHPDTDRFPAGRRYFSPSEGNPLHWKKAGSAKDVSYRGGFGPLNVSVSLDPWLPPVVAKPAKGPVAGVSAITLPQRLGLVTNNTATADIAISHGPEDLDLGELEDDLPFSATLAATATPTATTALTGIAPSTNLAKWKLTSLNPATGAFTGSFTLTDAVSVIPTPNNHATFKFVPRTVTFSGLLRQAPDGDAMIGTGFFLVPDLLSKTAEQPSGEIRLTAAPSE